MFPAASTAEARHCLAVAGGDIAKAAQLALHRQEAGQSIVSNLTFLTVRYFNSFDCVFNIRGCLLKLCKKIFMKIV